MSSLESDSCSERICGTLVGTGSNVSLSLEKSILTMIEEVGAGDGDRTRNIQLGNQNFRPFYYHNLQKRSAKINVHATRNVHAVPDLYIAGGTFGGGRSSHEVSITLNYLR